jgi:hypothetical protein
LKITNESIIESSRVYLDDFGIIHHEYLVQEIDIREAEKISVLVNQVADNAPNERKLLISTMNAVHNIPKESRDYLANYPTKYDWKIALVYNNIISQIISTFMLTLVKQRFETRIFGKREDAIKWLQAN